MVNNMQVIMVNNNNGNDIGSTLAEERRHDDGELIKAVLSAHPVLKQRWRFSPDAMSANCNGLYYCDPETNMWRQVHTAYVEDVLVDAFAQAVLLP